MVVQVVPANPREVCRLVEQDCGVPFTTQVGREIRVMLVGLYVYYRYNMSSRGGVPANPRDV